MPSRRKGMKLDQALKLYISLYVLCFMLTWLVSIPMLVHVMPHQECLLFVQRTIEYGPAGGNFFSCPLIFTKYLHIREDVRNLKLV